MSDGGPGPSRRRALTASGGAVAAALSGCLDRFRGESPSEQSDDEPDGVAHPEPSRGESSPGPEYAPWLAADLPEVNDARRDEVLRPYSSVTVGRPAWFVESDVGDEFVHDPFVMSDVFVEDLTEEVQPSQVDLMVDANMIHKVLVGSFDRDRLVEAVDDVGNRREEYRDHDVFVVPADARTGTEDVSRAVAISEEHVVVTSVTTDDGTPEYVVALLDATAGDANRLVDESDAVEEFVSHIGDGYMLTFEVNEDRSTVEGARKRYDGEVVQYRSVAVVGSDADARAAVEEAERTYMREHPDPVYDVSFGAGSRTHEFVQDVTIERDGHVVTVDGYLDVEDAAHASYWFP